MQDEVNEKTVSLCIRCGKVTANLLKAAMKKALVKMEQEKQKLKGQKQPKQDKDCLLYTSYLKEITAPSGYRVNATAYNVKLEVSKTTTVTVPDEEQLGQLTVYKEGEVLVLSLIHI